MPRQPVDINNTVMITVTDEKTILFSVNAVSLSGDFLLRPGKNNTLNLQCAQPFRLVMVDFFDTTPGTSQANPAGQHGKACDSAACPVVSAGGAQGPAFSSPANTILSLSLKSNSNKGVYKYSLFVDTVDGSVAQIDPQIIVQ